MTEIKFESSGEISVRKFHFGHARTSRTSIIRHLISRYDYQSYLEIGVRDFRNYDQIECAWKTAVDPHPLDADGRPLTENLFRHTSDSFFGQLDAAIRFDLIFIDGLHIADQVERDIAGALDHLNDGGTIVMHDCNPPTEFHQREVYKVDGKFPPWNGTTWKAFARNRMQHSDLSMAVVNTDWGVGLIRRGTQQCFPAQRDIDWPLLDAQRQALLNLISVEQFLDRH